MWLQPETLPMIALPEIAEEAPSAPLEALRENGVEYCEERPVHQNVLRLIDDQLVEQLAHAISEPLRENVEHALRQVLRSPPGRLWPAETKTRQPVGCTRPPVRLEELSR